MRVCQALFAGTCPPPTRCPDRCRRWVGDIVGREAKIPGSGGHFARLRLGGCACQRSAPGRAKMGARMGAESVSNGKGNGSL